MFPAQGVNTMLQRLGNRLLVDMHPCSAHDSENGLFDIPSQCDQQSLELYLFP
jgi:hypothetical protein